MRPFADAAVKARFEAYPPAVRERMLALRELIFRTAAASAGVGPLQETLKWAEPAYLTAETGSGSTLRIDWKARHPERCCLYFHCRTGLVPAFRERFRDDFTFEGNRALCCELGKPLPLQALTCCIEAALTYHLRRGPGGRRAMEPG